MSADEWYRTAAYDWGLVRWNEENLVLAALAAGGENATFSPVQVQKLLFVLDREASPHIDGPHFNFIPYDYGPLIAKYITNWTISPRRPDRDRLFRSLQNLRAYERRVPVWIPCAPESFR